MTLPLKVTAEAFHEFSLAAAISQTAATLSVVAQLQGADLSQGDALARAFLLFESSLSKTHAWLETAALLGGQPSQSPQ